MQDNVEIIFNTIFVFSFFERPLFVTTMTLESMQIVSKLLKVRKYNDLLENPKKLVNSFLLEK